MQTRESVDRWLVHHYHRLLDTTPIVSSWEHEVSEWLSKWVNVKSHRQQVRRPTTTTTTTAAAAATNNNCNYWYYQGHLLTCSYSLFSFLVSRIFIIMIATFKVDSSVLLFSFFFFFFLQVSSTIFCCLAWEHLLLKHTLLAPIISSSSSRKVYQDTHNPSMFFSCLTLSCHVIYTGNSYNTVLALLVC